MSTKNNKISKENDIEENIDNLYLNASLNINLLSEALKKCDSQATNFTSLETAFSKYVAPVLYTILNSPLQFPLTESVSPSFSCNDIVSLYGFLENTDVWFFFVKTVVGFLENKLKLKKEKKKNLRMHENFINNNERKIGEKEARHGNFVAYGELSCDESIKKCNIHDQNESLNNGPYDVFLTRCFVLACGATLPSMRENYKNDKNEFYIRSSRKKKQMSKDRIKLRWNFLVKEREQIEKSKNFTESNAAERKILLQNTALGIFYDNQHRIIFSKLWIRLLRSDTPAILNLHILRALSEDHILENLSNPLLLSDYFVLNFRAGGLVAILSLRGLFILMIDYGLEQPDFYTKLYSLITPDSFASRHRYELFKLLDVCMSSLRVPSYIAAAVIKRICRIAVMLPSPTLFFILPFVKQMFQRHSNCLALIHRTSKNDFILSSNEGSSDEKIFDYKNDDNNGSELDPKEKVSKLFDGIDPYLFNEAQLIKCNAIHSTLWEFCALEKHFLPVCPLIISSFQSTAIDKTPLRFEKTYGRLFAHEIARNMEKDDNSSNDTLNVKRIVSVAYSIPSLSCLDDISDNRIFEL